jgi:hypothetical protein
MSGPSGVGNTTLRLCNRLEVADAGTVCYGGQPLDRNAGDQIWPVISGAKCVLRSAQGDHFLLLPSFVLLNSWSRIGAASGRRAWWNHGYFRPAH